MRVGRRIVHTMKHTFRHLAVGVTLLTFAMAGAIAAETSSDEQVSVVFESPENFTDFTKSYTARDEGQDQLMAELRAHLVNQARSLLATGQRLEVRFLDIDLAGDFEPGRIHPSADHIRILKEIYPPSVKLEFRLLGADGKVMSEGKRELKELGYLVTTRLPSSDGMRYDKGLLTDWMRREFRRASR